MEDTKGHIFESTLEDESARSLSASRLIGRIVNSRSGYAPLFWGIMFLATSPFLIAYSRAMWYQEMYQYFPFLLLGVFGLAYSRYDGRIRFPEGKLVTGALAVCALVLTIAALMRSSWLGAIGFLFLTFAFLATLKGRNGKSLAYLALPMLMFIRAPQLWTYSVMYRLQLATTNLSSIVLDLFGIPHDHFANTIELATKHLFVAEACSGVQSLFTMCFLALLLLVYRRRTLWLAPVFLAAAVILAVFGNILRVTTIALAESWFSIDLAEGWPHELVGYIALAISAGVLLSFDHLISVLFHPIEAGESATTQNPMIMAWNKVFHARGENASDWSPTSRQAEETNPYEKYDAAFDAASGASARKEFPFVYRFIAGVAIICGILMIVGRMFGTTDRRPILEDNAVLFEPSEQFLSTIDAPITIVSHRSKRESQGDVNDRLGKHADVWTCGINGRQGEFVISQPYKGWHELTICYRVLNWAMLSRRPIDFPDEVEPIVVGTFQNEDGLYGYLFFAGIDSNGALPRTPGHSRSARILSPFYSLVSDDFAEMTGSAQTLMIQYWSVSEEEMAPSKIQEIASTMVKIRRQASQEIAKQTRELLPDS